MRTDGMSDGSAHTRKAIGHGAARTFLAIMAATAIVPPLTNGALGFGPSIALAATIPCDSIEAIQNAINSANEGDTIALATDINVTQEGGDILVIPAGKTITFDMAGHTLKGLNDTTAKANGALISNRGNLTVIDSVGSGKLVMGGTFDDASYGTGTYTINNMGTLTVKSGTIETSDDGARVVYAIDNITGGASTGSVTATIDGGTIRGVGNDAIRMFLNSTTQRNDLIVNGGIIEALDARGIWMQNANGNANNGSLTINGGEITGGSAAVYFYHRDGTNISGAIHGGTLTSVGDYYSYGPIWTNGVSDGNPIMSLTIDGGTFHTESDPTAYPFEAWHGNAFAGSVSGGTVDVWYIEPVDLATGHSVAKNDDGTWDIIAAEPTALVDVDWTELYNGNEDGWTLEGHPFAKVGDAINVTPWKGKTTAVYGSYADFVLSDVRFTVVADSVEDLDVDPEVDTTLDLNGHTITAATNANHANAGKLRIIDGGNAGNLATTFPGVLIGNTGELTFESGSFSYVDSLLDCPVDKAVIKGGWYTASDGDPYVIDPYGLGVMPNNPVETATYTLCRSIKDFQITVPDQTYDGTELKPVPTVIGTNNGSEIELVEGQDFRILYYEDNVNAGTATVVIEGTNGWGGRLTGTFKIARAKATVTADDKEKAKGDSDPELTATVSGLVGSDFPNVLRYGLSRVEGEAPGTYAIMVAGDEIQGNYEVAFVKGTMTIKDASSAEKPVIPESGGSPKTGTTVAGLPALGDATVLQALGAIALAICAMAVVIRRRS